MLSMLLLPSNRGVSNLLVRNSDLSRFSVATRVVRNLSVARKYATKGNMATTASAIKYDASSEVLSAWKNAEAVCFDVDSTLCTDESIDELAAYLGVGEQVAAMTANAMGGTVKFEDALAMRLGLMKVSRTDMQNFLRDHPPSLSPGIRELVSTLQAKGKAVFLVSGGFREIINPVADILSIPRSNVFANTILYSSEDGSYAGFDKQEYTSRSGGKPAAITHIRATHGYSRVVMIGDGATDLEARVPGCADLFIGYGGVVLRQKVAEGADWFVKDFTPLIKALE